MEGLQLLKTAPVNSRTTWFIVLFPQVRIYMCAFVPVALSMSHTAPLCSTCPAAPTAHRELLSPQEGEMNIMGAKDCGHVVFPF